VGPGGQVRAHGGGESFNSLSRIGWSGGKSVQNHTQLRDLLEPKIAISKGAVSTSQDLVK